MQKIDLPEDADEGVYHYAIDGQGRLILDTMHGQLIIDVRLNDVNAFVFENGKRVDRLLIRPPQAS